MCAVQAPKTAPLHLRISLISSSLPAGRAGLFTSAVPCTGKSNPIAPRAGSAANVYIIIQWHLCACSKLSNECAATRGFWSRIESSLSGGRRRLYIEFHVVMGMCVLPLDRVLYVPARLPAGSPIADRKTIAFLRVRNFY